MATTIAEIIDDPRLSKRSGFSDFETVFSAVPERLTKQAGPAFAFASDSWRDAGRKNASVATEKELQTLLDERKALLSKKLTAGLSREEADRLEYVRWSLDRIEDARHGYALDRLQSLVEAYKVELRELQRLNTEIRGRLPGRAK